MQQSIYAVALVVPDYDDAISFYVKKLNFTLDQDVDLGGGKRWVRVSPPGSTVGSLILAEADGGDQQAAIGNQTGGRVGFFLSTENFARDHTAMLAKGVHFEEEPRHEVYGTVAVWRDPFGNRWDLVQFAET